MPIFKTIIFICEKCGTMSSETEEAFLYDDPLINPPYGENWGFNDDDELCCLECLSKDE